MHQSHKHVHVIYDVIRALKGMLCQMQNVKAKHGPKIHSWCHYVHSLAWKEMLMLMKWMHATAAWCILSRSCSFGALRAEYIPFRLLVVHRRGSSIHGNCRGSYGSSRRMIGVLSLTKGILRIRSKVKENRWDFME